MNVFRMFVFLMNRRPPISTRTDTPSPYTTLFPSEAHRQLGQASQDEALYRGLLNGKLAADAYHGLGLLYARRERGASVQYLREATRRKDRKSTRLNSSH